MAVDTDISEALTELIAEFGEAADGRTIKIYALSGGLSYSGDGLVTGGSGELDMVTGGGYDKDTYFVTIIKSAAGSFVPAPDMLVDLRSKELRIAKSDFTDARAHWRFKCIGRDVPE